jgi:hypothetical protein
MIIEPNPRSGLPAAILRSDENREVDSYRLQFSRRTGRPTRIGGLLFRAKPAGSPVDVRDRRCKFEENRVTACGGISSMRSFEHRLDPNRPKTRPLVRPRPLSLKTVAALRKSSQGRSEKRACLWTVGVAREGRNSFHIPPPEAGTLYFAGTRNGPLERHQASERVSRAKGFPLFE